MNKNNYKFKIKKIFSYLRFDNLFKRFANKDKSATIIKAPPITAEMLNLDTSFSYVLLQASFGDKWCILSYMQDFLVAHRDSKMIASIEDKTLIRIFIGNDMLNSSVLFLEKSVVEQISSMIYVNSETSNQIILDVTHLVQSDLVMQRGFPKNLVKHLHIVKYPYFSDLYILYGVPYATLLKALLYLPNTSRARAPHYYDTKDFEDARSIVSVEPIDQSPLTILFNIVNISYQPLSLEQVRLVVCLFEAAGIKVLINATGYGNRADLLNIIEKGFKSVVVDVPAHLLALVCQNVSAVCGVLGGAMNIAVQFSKSHCLVIYTKPVGFDRALDSIFGGKYNDNMWRLYDEDWPCLHPERVVETIDVGNPTELSNENLRKIILEFISKIRANTNCVSN